ncbi:MAG: GntR family transcriptional regulator [Pseudomonadota bacterium]
MMVSRIKQPALYEEVAERLRQRIFRHELAPGAWIDEQALAEEFGISRTPLREALKVLAAEGLVTLKPRRGCYVTELSEQDLDEIFDLMALLEGRCAAEAVRRMGAGALAQLERLHDELERAAAAGDIDRFFEANQGFHLTLQQIAGNRWLLQVIQDLRKVMKLNRHHSLFLEGRLEQSLEEHRAIMEAIRDRDAARAEEAMRAHLRSGRRALSRMQAAATTPAHHVSYE